MRFWGKHFLILMSVWVILLAPTLSWAKTDQKSLDRAQHEFVQGSRYYHGRGTEKDMDKALAWYMKSAEKGHAKSELAVSQVLMFGDPKKPQYDAALPWLIKASRRHKTPQISGMKQAVSSAKKNLRWMCQKGLVDFPERHPYANDPKCWLNRGNRLFVGSSLPVNDLQDDTRKYYGIKKDYVSAKNYLEKAFDAGETEAAINLAKIYLNGFGTPKDVEKYDYYVKFAAAVNHNKSNFYLAEKALEAKTEQLYSEKIYYAAQSGEKRALSALGWAYFNSNRRRDYEDEITADLDTNNETAFAYFFLAGRRQYVRNRRSWRLRNDDIFLPFLENKFLATFQSEISLDLLARSRAEALNFAKENKFSSSHIKIIDKSYYTAVDDLNYFKEGGKLNQSRLWLRLLYLFLLFISIYTISTVSQAFIKGP